MLISGFLRASVWSNIVRNWKKGVDGNLEGEGRLLGGRFCKSAAETVLRFSGYFLQTSKLAGYFLRASYRWRGRAML